NPDHKAFWGYTGDFDQKTVETAAFGLALALNGPKLLQQFSQTEIQHLHEWMVAVSKSKTPDNNWNLFKVMVNTGLAQCGLEYDQEANEQAFAKIENYYLG